MLTKTKVAVYGGAVASLFFAGMLLVGTAHAQDDTLAQNPDSPPPTTAHIIVNKVTNLGPSDQTPFSFTATGSGDTSYSSSFSLSNGGSQDLTVAPGSYTVTEGADLPHWSLTASECHYEESAFGSGVPRGLSFDLEAGETVSCTFTNTYSKNISGTKFNDANGDGVKGPDESGLSGWTIVLCQPTASVESFGIFASVASICPSGTSQASSTTTNGSGGYSFTGLADGTYTVCENVSGPAFFFPTIFIPIFPFPSVQPWFQTLPSANTPNSTSCGDNGHGYSVTISSNNPSYTADFGNNQLSIGNEAVANAYLNYVTITWDTSHPATSRLVYDTVSHNPAGTNFCPAPNTSLSCYGYAFTTNEDSTLTTHHTVVANGLNSSVQYFFRPVSHGSPEVTGTEIGATTSGSGGSAPSGGGGPPAPPVTPPTTPPAAPSPSPPGTPPAGPSPSLPATFSNTSPLALNNPPAGLVLGASTGLPRTGIPIQLELALITAVAVLPFVLRRKHA